MDVDRYFSDNIFDTSHSQRRRVIVSTGSNEKSFAFKLLQFSHSMTHQRCILQDQKKSPKKLSSLVDSVRDFLKTFDKASNCLQIPFLKSKIEMGSTKSKDNRFALQ